MFSDTLSCTTHHTDWQHVLSPALVITEDFTYKHISAAKQGHTEQPWGPKNNFSSFKNNGRRRCWTFAILKDAVTSSPYKLEGRQNYLQIHFEFTQGETRKHIRNFETEVEFWA
ncbi:hypothetical protein Y1Q_0009846 [Alligator mississippiensis]|uniref:Uncharacterized protein n=1 Tax=Alligator mississippiensis TaxID=8496 RepID=A0A151MX03_ALLMI|nr:hypothetical protein Y1Q_0009846 [Alligator mississippiensis]